MGKKGALTTKAPENIRSNLPFALLRRTGKNSSRTSKNSDEYKP
jgi:hypothetical protein